MCLSIIWSVSIFFAGAAIAASIMSALAMCSYDDERQDAWDGP